MSKPKNRWSVVLAMCLMTLVVIAGTVVVILALMGKFNYTSQDDKLLNVEFVNEYPTISQVGMSSEILGNVKRQKPQTSDGGLVANGTIEAYPKYNVKTNYTNEQKTAIIAENNTLCGAQTTNASGQYTWIDEKGNLYNGTTKEPQALNRQLYKHTAAAGMYGGDVADQEPAVIKKIKYLPRAYNSYYEITGLYAPAGEVVKIQISGADMTATGGLIIHIGQALFNGAANNIWTARDFNRMPVILNTLAINQNTAVYDEKTDTWTAYIGSFLGGPIYVRDEKVAYSVTISGAVQYTHFILGQTTEDDYAVLLKSSAPYFDLAIWSTGILHSGPKTSIKNLAYDEIYQAAILWEKIGLVTTKVKNHGVVMIYDPFVAAGAAVAFVNWWSVNCPISWMNNSFNYEQFMTTGCWGNLHEYHHNYQNFGVGATDEVTNNALNLVAYSLFTNISTARQIENYGVKGLSDWNRYTSATWCLNQINAGGSAITGTNGLAVYATLLHNFGQDAFIKSTGKSGNQYFNRWAELTHQDFTYYADQISDYAGALNLAANDYPMFVPVSCVYQTGRSYLYDQTKRYIKTMQPYAITQGQPVTVDLNPYTINEGGQYAGGSIVIGNGFKYRIKKINIEQMNGTFTPTDQANVYTYTPGENFYSGKIYVTLEITTTTGEHTYQGKQLDDVDLVLEFQQSISPALERTIYTFAEDLTGRNANEIYASGYAGHLSKVTVDNLNSVQNSNTDIWLFADEINKFQVMEINGKLFFKKPGQYRINLRGRGSCALYLSTDGGQTYEYRAYVDHTINPAGHTFLDDERTYYDLKIEKARTWIYFKEVMVVATVGNKTSFVGLGVDGNYAVGYHCSCLEPLDTTAEYFYIPEYSTTINDQVFQQIAPDDNRITYTGNWHLVAGDTNFGHCYTGSNKTRFSLTFTGTQFAILSAIGNDAKFTVTIDGEVLDSATITDTTQKHATVTYLSPELNNQQHTVVIQCLSKTTIDSIAIR